VKLSIPQIRIERPILLDMAATVAAGLAVAPLNALPGHDGRFTEEQLEQADRDIAARALHIAALIVEYTDKAIDAAAERKRK
jgi:hypothetical protein